MKIARRVKLKVMISTMDKVDLVNLEIKDLGLGQEAKDMG